MRKLVIPVMVIFGLFFPMQLLLVKASIQPQLEKEDVSFIQVNRLNGETRLFKENDGYEEVIIGKVVNWINTSSPSEGAIELELNKTSIISILKIKMKNGDVAVIEPAYNCVSLNQLKTCTIADGEVIYTSNNKRFD